MKYNSNNIEDNIFLFIVYILYNSKGIWVCLKLGQKKSVNYVSKEVYFMHLFLDYVCLDDVSLSSTQVS